MPKWCDPIVIKTDKLTKVVDPIFERTVYVIIAKNESEYVKLAKEYLEYDLEESHREGIFIPFDNKQGIECGLICSIDKGMALMHECLHAAVWASNTVGLPINENNDEFLAYYQGFIFQAVTKD